MKHLHLLRHAKSNWDDPDLDDHDRPLAERGLRAGAAMAAHLGETLAPDLVLCSTARRAVDTLAFLVPGLDGVPVLYERKLYTFTPEPLLERLRALPETVTDVLLVGHNPALQDLAVMLCRKPDGGTVAAGGDPRALRDKFPTAALASLELMVERWTAVDRGSAVLTRFMRPKDLPTA